MGKDRPQAIVNSITNGWAEKALPGLLADLGLKGQAGKLAEPHLKRALEAAWLAGYAGASES